MHTSDKYFSVAKAWEIMLYKELKSLVCDMRDSLQNPQQLIFLSKFALFVYEIEAVKEFI